MLGGFEAERCCHEVRFEIRRCVKMRLRSPNPLGEGNREEEMKGLGREMGWKREIKGEGGTEGVGRGNEDWGKFGSRALGGIDAPEEQNVYGCCLEAVADEYRPKTLKPSMVFIIISLV